MSNYKNWFKYSAAFIIAPISLSTLLWLVPFNVFAITLGKIKVASHLNEPLNATVAVHTDSALELDQIQAKLAADSRFNAMNLPRAEALDDFKFGIEYVGHNNYQIKVSSNNPIKEPFVEFLLEINSPEGSLVKQYNMLLDPADLIADNQPQPQPKPQQQAKVTKTQLKLPAAIKPQVNQASLYGPLTANDTLWSIAKKYRPQNVSMQEMMQAIVHENPDAFVDADANKMRKDGMLKIPAPQQTSAEQVSKPAPIVKDIVYKNPVPTPSLAQNSVKQQVQVEPKINETETLQQRLQQQQSESKKLQILMHAKDREIKQLKAKLGVAETFVEAVNPDASAVAKSGVKCSSDTIVATQPVWQDTTPSETVVPQKQVEPQQSIKLQNITPEVDSSAVVINAETRAGQSNSSSTLWFLGPALLVLGFGLIYMRRRNQQATVKVKSRHQNHS